MSTVEINAEVNKKLDEVRAALASEIAGKGDVCLTCSFQAEDVLLTKLAIALDPAIPVLFLDTGYHFRETYDYRDRIAQEWGLNLTNLLPEKTVAEQEAEHGLLYQTAPDRCCGLRKVEPLFKAVANYRVWITGLRREQIDEVQVPLLRDAVAIFIRLAEVIAGVEKQHGDFRV